MAEAAAAARFSGASARGTQLAYDRNGLHVDLSFTIPPPQQAIAGIRRFMRRSYYALRDALFPNPLPLFIGVVASVIGAVLSSGSESWWRSGWIASIVWAVSEWFPWFGVPKEVRLAVLATWAAVVGCILIAACQRLLLQLLLSYQGFLYLEHGKPVPLHIKAWFFATRLLLGAYPLMYSFQSALPPLPVPPLKQTVDKFVESARALHGEDSEAFKKVQEQAASFLTQEGPTLQRYLNFKWAVSPNYMTDWWEQYVYLMGRDPIMVNSNYYVLDSGRVISSPVQTSRAACVTHGLLRFRFALEDEAIEPILVQKTVPLCMWQYKRIFATTRVPGRDMDTLQHYDITRSRHIVVLCKGSMYRLPVYKGDGSLLSMSELDQAYAEIKDDAWSKFEHGNVDEHEARIPALTAWNRTKWAEVRETYFGDGVNRDSLHTIESAAFFVALDDTESEVLDWSKRGRDMIGGTGSDRWFDKSFTLVVQRNGKVGVNCEHSWADAPVMAHVLEVAMIVGEHIMNPYDEHGFVRVPEGLTRAPVIDLMHRKNQPMYTKSAVDLSDKPDLNMDKAAAYFKNYFASARTIEAGEFICGDTDVCGRGVDTSWTALRWALPRGAMDAIDKAAAAASELLHDLDLQVVTHTHYGKRFMKQCGVSPDAYTQMALQLAYFRDQGRFANTYEASMTRLFRRGRTETVRPVTSAAVAFIKAMDNPSVEATEKLRLLQAAAEVHVQAYTDCMAGKGIDRHMFALYVVSKGKSIDSPFLKGALSEPWRLSTSQQPQQQTSVWNLKDPKWAKYISPGGGFGPVAKDGYGVSYMQAGEDEMFFHISSSQSAKNTDSEKFKQHLFEALKDMKAVLSPVLKSKQAGK